jgi:hypothetical protein
MAIFCVGCGAQLADGTKFCNKCGAQVTAPAGAPVATTPAYGAPPAAPAPTSQGSSAAVKILLIVLAVIMFIILLAGGACFYVAYRVKQKVHEVTQDMGAETTPYAGKRAPCDMLSTAEATQALGKPVVSAEPRGTTSCSYGFGPGGNQQFSVDFTWQGGGTAMKFAHLAMKHISGMETYTPLNGIGDEAYVAPGGSSVMMRKGDVMVNIDTRASGVSVNAAKEMAGRIADHLEQ